jgi:hypothetical protein
MTRDAASLCASKLTQAEQGPMFSGERHVKIILERQSPGSARVIMGLLLCLSRMTSRDSSEGTG